jgi:hypothetical protein
MVYLVKIKSEDYAVNILENIYLMDNIDDIELVEWWENDGD